MEIAKRDIRILLKEKYGFGELPKDKKSPVYEDIKRLKNKEPLDYVIGFKDFLDCRIDLSLKTLIPRIESEFWVDTLIKKILSENSLINSKSNKLKILDLCCGSGCIGIAILKYLPNTSVDFVDIDQKALDQTKLNLSLNAINKERYQIIKSNLFLNVKNKYDYILCNPPYVNPEGSYQKSIIFEPRLALFAKKQGLELIFNVLKDVNKYLKPNGVLYLEFGFNQKDKIEKYCKKKAISTIFYKDQFSVFRYAVISKMERKLQ